MKKKITFALSCIWLACYCGFVLAQAPIPSTPQKNQGDGFQVLQKTSEIYKSMKSSYFEGLSTLEFTSKQANLKVDMPLVIADTRPNKVRFEMKDAKFGGTRVSDGKSLWVYQPRTNQYTRKPVSAETPASTLKGSAEYEQINERVKSARILREESLVVNGVRVNCYVIELVTESENANPDIVTHPRLLWIDKANHLILKDIYKATLNATKGENAQVENTFTKVISVAKVNQSIPDSVFLFVPPEGAKEVEKID
jgi:outer membrane lipoprotein-sorting protein